VVKDGKLEAVGKLDDLLVSCEELKRLWAGDGESKSEVDGSAE
jgi:hypothetical protein